jgi:hypothetical protein
MTAASEISAGASTLDVAIRGMTCAARVGAQTVLVGSDRMMRTLGLDLQPFAATAHRLADRPPPRH